MLCFVLWSTSSARIRMRAVTGRLLEQAKGLCTACGNNERHYLMLTLFWVILSIFIFYFLTSKSAKTLTKFKQMMLLSLKCFETQ